MKTNMAYTYEVLGGYLMSDGHVSVEYLAEEIRVLGLNTYYLYEDLMNKRIKDRNVAIRWLMGFIDRQLLYYRPGYRATNKQVMAFDQEHYGDLEKVLDILEQSVKQEREELAE